MMQLSIPILKNNIWIYIEENGGTTARESSEDAEKGKTSHLKNKEIKTRLTCKTLVVEEVEIVIF